MTSLHLWPLSGVDLLKMVGLGDMLMEETKWVLFVGDDELESLPGVASGYWRAEEEKKALQRMVSGEVAKGGERSRRRILCIPISQ